jgi:hypothetical protein
MVTTVRYIILHCSTLSGPHCSTLFYKHRFTPLFAVLHCSKVFHIVQFHTVPRCLLLFYSRSTLFASVLLCSTLFHWAPHCSALFCAFLHSYTLFHTVPHSLTLIYSVHNILLFHLFNVLFLSVLFYIICTVFCTTLYCSALFYNVIDLLRFYTVLRSSALTVKNGKFRKILTLHGNT